MIQQPKTVQNPKKPVQQPKTLHNPKKTVQQLTTVQQPKKIQQSEKRKKKKNSKSQNYLIQVLSWQPDFLAKISIPSRNKNYVYLKPFSLFFYYSSIHQSQICMVHPYKLAPGLGPVNEMILRNENHRS